MDPAKNIDYQISVIVPVSGRLYLSLKEAFK